MIGEAEWAEIVAGGLAYPHFHNLIAFLYPVLAERLADLTIPELPLKGAADDRQVIESNLLGLWAAPSSGGDDKSFVARDRNPGEPLRSGFGKALVEAVGPLKRAVLVRVEPDGWRVYRLQLRRKQWDWAVKAADSGRIADMHPA